MADTGVSQQAISEAKAWGANFVRVSLGEQFWLSSNCDYVPGYESEVDKVVGWITSLGMVALLDLHTNTIGSCQTGSQHNMADEAQSPTFLSDLAARYGNPSSPEYSPLVAFDLYNEPHDISASVWLNGGATTDASTGIAYEAAGMHSSTTPCGTRVRTASRSSAATTGPVPLRRLSCRATTSSTRRITTRALPGTPGLLQPRPLRCSPGPEPMARSWTDRAGRGDRDSAGPPSPAVRTSPTSSGTDHAGMGLERLRLRGSCGHHPLGLERDLPRRWHGGACTLGHARPPCPVGIDLNQRPHAVPHEWSAALERRLLRPRPHYPKRSSAPTRRRRHDHHHRHRGHLSPRLPGRQSLPPAPGPGCAPDNRPASGVGDHGVVPVQGDLGHHNRRSGPKPTFSLGTRRRPGRGRQEARGVSDCRRISEDTTRRATGAAGAVGGTPCRGAFSWGRVARDPVLRIRGWAIRPQSARSEQRAARRPARSSTRSVGNHAVPRRGNLQGAASSSKNAPTTAVTNGPANNSGQTGATASNVASAGASWSPQPAIYGTGKVLDLPVTMADGTVLQADVYFPDDGGHHHGGRRALPGAAATDAVRQGVHRRRRGASPDTNVNYLVDRGLHRRHRRRPRHRRLGRHLRPLRPGAVDRRGHPRPAGRPTCPQSNGEVGLFGESYMGINQFQTVAGGRAGRRRSRRCSRSSRATTCIADTVTQGGIPDAEFDAAYIALVSGLNLTNPALAAAGRGGGERQPAILANGAGRPDAHRVVAHSSTLLSFLQQRLGLETGQGARRLRRAVLGGPQPGARPGRRGRRPHPRLPGRRVERPLPGGRAPQLRRPAEPLRRAARSTAAMTADQPVTPRYQLLMGPWQHVTTGDGRQHVRHSSSSGSTLGCWASTPRCRHHHAVAPGHQNSSSTVVDGRRSGPCPTRHATPYYFGAGPKRQRRALAQRRHAVTAARPTSWTGSRPRRLHRAREPVRHPDGPVGRRPLAVGLPVSWARTTPATSTTSPWARGPER